MGHRHQLTARALREALGGVARAVGSSGASLEVVLPAQEAAHTRASALLHDATMRAHAVAPSTPGVGAGFGAFLDGVQESRVVAYVGTIPIVHGRVGAVVRARVNRRLVTWGDGARTDDALYLPVAAVPAHLVDALVATGCPVIDTDDDALPVEEAHPRQLLRRAVHLVQRGREALEHALAEAWSAAPGDATLYIDGGLPPSAGVLRSGRVIGVIKSHHTLYAVGPALATVMSLGAGERSSVFVVETRWREPVASWYVRLRAPGHHDPLWGLVRVECPLPLLTGQADPDAAADRLSTNVIAEASPLSLPDARWDTMAYGIRDCEVYLRATLGRLAT
ncbi:MAG: hypothetical protein IT360_12805 [Gemmatimonadaceae bacterium]|nr:hypothetical protein [Gemmatimonadaceae bacterium]